MEINLLLIASESDNQKQYLTLLKDLGVSITAVPSFNNLHKSKLPLVIKIQL